MSDPALSVIILAKDEEKHIGRAILAMRSFPLECEIIVVDSGSADRTVAIAEQLGALTVTHEFKSHADQLNWALNNVQIRAPWVLRLDADEVVYPDLLENLKRAMQTVPLEVTGLLLNRRHIFQGRWVRHGARYPLWLLRAWRNGAAVAEDRWMDEHMILRSGSSRAVPGRFEDRSLLSIGDFVAKHNRYASLEAVDRLYPQTEHVKLPGFRNRLKRSAKTRIYNKLPSATGPTLYFIWRLTVGLGFLDGSSGITYHFLQGFWYRLLVELKVAELQALVTDDPRSAATIRSVAAATGVDASLISDRLNRP